MNIYIITATKKHPNGGYAVRTNEDRKLGVIVIKKDKWVFQCSGSSTYITADECIEIAERIKDIASNSNRGKK